MLFLGNFNFANSEPNSIHYSRTQSLQILFKMYQTDRIIVSPMDWLYFEHWCRKLVQYMWKLMLILQDLQDHDFFRRSINLDFWSLKVELLYNTLIGASSVGRKTLIFHERSKLLVSCKRRFLVEVLLKAFGIIRQMITASCWILITTNIAEVVDLYKPRKR